MGHPFVDGNKRIGHAAMEAFLMLNGFEIVADVDEQEDLFLRLAARWSGRCWPRGSRLTWSRYPDVE
jgi:death-on-curing protein